MQCPSVWFPAAVAAVQVFGRGRSPRQRQWALAVALLQPAAVLIDHGHFQYNNLSLGFAVSRKLQAEVVRRLAQQSQ